jgi:hypothetical protein
MGRLEIPGGPYLWKFQAARIYKKENGLYSRFG